MQQKPPEFEASTELASPRAPSRLTFSESWSNDIGLSSCRPEKQARTRQPVQPLRGCAIALFPNFTSANVRASVGSCPSGSQYPDARFPDATRVENHCACAWLV